MLAVGYADPNQLIEELDNPDALKPSNGKSSLPRRCGSTG